jgi:hypothetical protein
VFAALDQGWAALLGAIVGGAATLAGTVLTGYLTGRAAKKRERALLAATALLVQDDFWHFQATLARAIDRSQWWDLAEMLKQQATIEDRKAVWAALPTTAETNDVAAAQGWMDYLNQRRKALPAGAPTLGKDDLETIKMTFCLLEQGRRALAELAGRAASGFQDSRVLRQLTNRQQIVELLIAGCAQNASVVP